MLSYNNMMESELAQSLFEDATYLVDQDLALPMFGVPIYFDEVSTAMFRHQENDKKWEEFLKEAQKLRDQSGTVGSISLLQGLYMFSKSNKTLQGSLNGKEFIELEDEGMLEVLNRVLEPDLRPDFLREISYLVGDRSINWLNKDIIVDLLRDKGLNKGILLDLGCGVGEQINEWRTKSGLTVIGLDRQYHTPWYDEVWHQRIPELGFVQADFRVGIPLQDNSVTATVMEYVVNHIDQRSLALGLQETKRVLREDGILVVGPQDTYKPATPHWRIFEKKGNNLLEQ